MGFPLQEVERDSFYRVDRHQSFERRILLNLASPHVAQLSSQDMRESHDEGKEKQMMEIMKLTEENRRCLLCSSKHEFSEQCPFSETGVTI